MSDGAAGRERAVCGVRLTISGRALPCDAGALPLPKGTEVMIDAGHGPQLGTVVVAPAPRAARGPLHRVVRVANDHDRQRHREGQQQATAALALARRLASARHMPIKMFRAEIAPGGGRALFYFSSEQRVDFRDLVRDLAAELHTRIEMRQMGARDEAKMVGGIGACGRELCCTTFLPQFAPISIKMAKHQNLVLNPARVSGQCGRLKCCLVYEDAQYVEAGKLLPKPGKRVDTPDGPGRVADVDVLAGKVRVYFEGQPPKVYPATDVKRVDPPDRASDSHETESGPDDLPTS